LDTEVAKLVLQSDRIHGGSSLTMWFHGNRTGYRFIMTSDAALDFTAQKCHGRFDGKSVEHSE